MTVGSLASNAGLVSQGMNEAQSEQQRLALGQQQVDTGGIGLAELQRQTGAAKSNRAAISNVDPATGQYGALTALAQQQKANGDPEYMQTQDQIDKLMLQGRSDMAQAAVYGLPADQAEQQHMEKFGTDSIVPGSLEFGTNPENGHHMVSAIDPKTQQRKTWDASQFMSMQQAPVTLHPNEKVVRPLTGETVSENPILESGRYGVVEQSGQGRHVVTPGPLDKASVKTPEGGETQYLYNSETGKWVSPPGGGGTKSAGPTSKDLPYLKTVSDEIEKNEKMGQINPDTGKPSVTGAGSNAKILAGELYYASKNDGNMLDPHLAAAIAVEGATNPASLVKDQSTGKRYIQYQGKYYERAQQQGGVSIGAPGTTATDQAEGTTSDAAIGPVGKPRQQSAPVQAAMPGNLTQEDKTLAPSPYTPENVVSKMKQAQAQGATIEQIAASVRRDPEWVRQQLGQGASQVNSQPPSPANTGITPKPIASAQPPNNNQQVDQHIANLQKLSAVKAEMGGKPGDPLEKLMLSYDAKHGHGEAMKLVLSRLQNQQQPQQQQTQNAVASGYAKGGKVSSKGLC